MLPTVSITNASLAYASSEIFSNLNLHLPKGKWISLLGASGIGKTSILRMLAGLMTPPAQSRATITSANNIPLQQQIAYMAQADLLLPWLSVLDNAMLGFKLRNETHGKKDLALSLLNKVGLGAAVHLYPQQLSGGMRQRVALVRTLLEDKDIILMDEPFSAVDAITRYKLQNLAAELLRDKTVLFITHDPTEALRLAHEIYLMHGKPASLTRVASLTSQTPRAVTHPEVLDLQSHLFQELANAAE